MLLQCKLNSSRVAQVMMGSTILFGMGIAIYLPLPLWLRMGLFSWIFFQLFLLKRRQQDAVIGFRLQDDARCQLYTFNGVLEARYLPKAIVCRYCVILYCETTTQKRRVIPVTIWCDAVDPDMFRRLTVFAEWGLVK